MPHLEGKLQSVHRAIADLRRGGMVLLRGDNGDTSLICAAEQVTPSKLKTLSSAAASSPYLLIPPNRARAIGLDPKAESSACSILLPSRLGVETILGLVGNTPLPKKDLSLTVLGEKKGSMAEAILMLMLQARLLPAAITSHISRDNEREIHASADVLIVEEAAVREFKFNQAMSLHEVARAKLPLADAEQTEIALFRPEDGGLEHFALLVHPNAGGDIAKPPLVRVHSQCVTGDILGSLKCDCGNQLRKAIKQMAASSGGALIYLAQEGRDIGLVNKIRAYALQDDGLDTVDANHALGFETDHRYFLPAAEMLRQLGYDKIKLLTNNPEKIQQLEQAGINITERVKIVAGLNPHNERYLDTKKKRTGHMID